MLKILKQQSKHEKIKLIKQVEKIESIESVPNHPSKIKLEADIYSGACISCTFPTCIKYHSNEVKNSLTDMFSSDLSEYVCAVDAIKWPSNLDTPLIDENSCINCGVCALRCPIGAIYLTETHAVVNDNSEIEYEIVEINENSSIKFEEQLQKLSRVPRKGTLILESSHVLETQISKIVEISRNSNFVNLLVRNMMISLGVDVSISRQGDVYNRIDGVTRFDAGFGIVEIEIGKDALSLPRAILDDIAGLVSMHQFNLLELHPLVIMLSLPNERSEYWRVIKDIKKVIGLEINTITLHVLFLLVWNLYDNVSFLKKFSFDNLFQSNRVILENEIGRKLNIPIGLYGVIEAEK
ncbi:MAG: 4Fe-4S binding protein [Erysipelothrix sp.]|jgi:NAD-dependent dihydropyrimidine dehydrogenase PreA subunit|nr:4Fe-4S binding protein [Erysipelothrix sp.]